MPVVESEVDKCIECGYCEQRCPSRDFTMTPRQRIGIRRALQRLKAEGKTEIITEITKNYTFDGMDTCAVDGMCATDCPVDINTGELIKRLRRENHSPKANEYALKVAKNFKILEKSARFAIGTGWLMNRVLGKNFMKNVTKTARFVVPSSPLWSNEMSKPPFWKGQWTKIRENAINTEGGNSNEFAKNIEDKNLNINVLYFPSCINRMMGGDILDTFQSVCKKAHINVLLPHNISGTCCGQIFSSKGFTDAYRFTANETLEKLWQNTEGGKFAVVMDVTSCTQSLLTSRPYLTSRWNKCAR